MATVQVKRETLKNIGNVQDWALKQRSKDGKKEVAKPLKPRSTASKPKITTIKHAHASPVVFKPSIVPQPIKEEVIEPIETGVVQTPNNGSKVRRIYSREFLIKFKYSTTPFPPGVQTPLDLINQYNKEFELKEQQRMALENTSTPSAFLPSSSSSSSSSTAIPVEASTAEKPKKMMIKKEKKDDKNTFKLRLANTDDSILRSPLFRSSSSSSKTPSSSTPLNNNNKGDDKENPVPVKSVRSSSVSKRPAVSSSSSPSLVIKKEKESKKTSPSAPAVDSFAVPISIAEPAPILASPALEEAAKADAVMADDAKQQELVDVLSKKLKNALKETDPRRLAQRQKQIEYGKATPGYQDYCKQTAKSKRKREDPKTPNKYQVCSKRSWDGQIRKWRRMLHMYDPVELKEAQAKNPTDTDDIDMDMVDGKPFSFEITAADLLAEEKALME